MGEKEIGFIRNVLGLMEDPSYQRPARKLVLGIVDLLQKGALGMNLDDLQKVDRKTVDDALRVTMGEDMEDMREDSNATKGDLQKLRVEMRTEFGVVKKSLKELVEQWNEIQVLAEGPPFPVSKGTPASYGTATPATPGNALGKEETRPLRGKS